MSNSKRIKFYMKKLILILLKISKIFLKIKNRDLTEKIFINFYINKIFVLIKKKIINLRL
jgi:hypothetical protein